MQEIIDTANIGRTTFYAHFETKDDLLKALCEVLFDHIISSATDCTHTHGLYSDKNAPESVFCHLLQHLQEDENNILELLSCESSELFLRYFKDSLNELIKRQFVGRDREKNADIPEDFLVNHISGSFVEMVLWWIRGADEADAGGAGPVFPGSHRAGSLIGNQVPRLIKAGRPD